MSGIFQFTFSLLLPDLVYFWFTYQRFAVYFYELVYLHCFEVKKLGGFEMKKMFMLALLGVAALFVTACGDTNVTLDYAPMVEIEEPISTEEEVATEEIADEVVADDEIDIDRINALIASGASRDAIMAQLTDAELAWVMSQRGGHTGGGGRGGLFGGQ